MTLAISPHDSPRPDRSASAERGEAGPGVLGPMPGEGRLRVAIVVLVLVGFGLRLVALGERALHHDESLDAWFSEKFLDGTYDGYDPIYHGPLRFYITAAIYWLFGITVTSARLISVFAGTALIGLPWFLRRRLGTVGTATAAVILCFSPSFLYFSRFAREDVLFAFVSLTFVVLLFAHIERPRRSVAIGLILAIVAAWAVKESVFLLILVVGSFLLVELANEAFEQARRPVPPALLVLGLAALAVLAFSLGDPIVLNLAWWGALLVATVGLGLIAAARNGGSFAATRLGAATRGPGPSGWLAAVAVGIVAFVVLFTVWLTDWNGSSTASTPHNAVIDGLIGGWNYWQSQQDVNRGGEPWFFYLFTIPLYEYVAVFLAIIGTLRELRRSTLFGRFALWSSIVSLAAYSYAGERMPWLVLHPLLPIVLLAALGAQHMWEHRSRLWAVGAAVAVSLGVLATGVASFRVSYLDGEQPRELLSQAGQASPELASTVERLHALDRLVQAEDGRPLSVLVDTTDSAAWPYVFYLRDLAGVLYVDLSSPPPLTAFDVVIVVERNQPAVAGALAGWSSTAQQHREWWVPSYTDGLVSGWARWLVDREVWLATEVGGVGETVYVSPTLGSLEVRAADLVAG